jgi:hypothetical protein
MIRGVERVAREASLAITDGRDVTHLRYRVRR